MRFTSAIAHALLASVVAASPVLAQGEVIGSSEWYVPVGVPNEGFVSVSASSWQPPSVPVQWVSTGVRENGTLVIWSGSGPPGVGERGTFTSPLTDVAAVSCPVLGSTLVLHRDGTISCNFLPPGPNERFVAVAAGAQHRLALRDDGSIVAWGTNTNGECNVPEPNEGYLAIAVVGSPFGGFGKSYAITQDGSIVGWGYGGPVLITDPLGFIAFSVGGHNQKVAIRTDGSAVVWSLLCPEPCDLPGPFVACAARQMDGYPGEPLLLRDDGTVVGGFPGESDITAIAAADVYHVAVRGRPVAAIQFAPPGAPMLVSAMPNPFSFRTVITAPAAVRDLIVYDSTGRLVRALGQTMEWDGLDAHGQSVSAGVYFLRLDSPQGPRSLRVVRLH